MTEQLVPQPGPRTGATGETAPSPPGKAVLYRKLAAVLAEVERVPKNGVNQFFHYRYATESDLVDVLRPALAKNGIAVFFTVVGIETIDMKGHKQGDLTRVQYEYRTLDGQLFTCVARDLDDARARCADWLVSVAVHRSVARLSSRLADRLADQEPIRG